MTTASELQKQIASPLIHDYVKACFGDGKYYSGD